MRRHMAFQSAHATAHTPFAPVDKRHTAGAENHTQQRPTHEATPATGSQRGRTRSPPLRHSIPHAGHLNAPGSPTGTGATQAPLAVSPAALRPQRDSLLREQRQQDTAAGATGSWRGRTRSPPPSSQANRLTSLRREPTRHRSNAGAASRLTGSLSRPGSRPSRATDQPHRPSHFGASSQSLAPKV